MTTGQKILKWTIIVTVCLSSLTFSFLATRKPWVLVGTVAADRSATHENLNSVYSHLIRSVQLGETWHELDTGMIVNLGDGIDWQDLTYENPAGLLVARLFIPHVEMVQIRFLSCRVTIRASAVALAMDQYEQRQGVLPPTLDALAPEYLDKIPEDPFRAGHPLIYKRELDRNWIIYSVGTNGVDDGGKFEKGRSVGPDIGISTHDFVTATSGFGP